VVADVDHTVADALLVEHFEIPAERGVR